MSPYLRSMREMIFISLFSLIGFSAQTQCVYEITQNRQIIPPGEGCPLGTFGLAIAPIGPSYPIFEALYLNGVLYTTNVYNYGGSPYMVYQDQVPPGSYQFYLNDSGAAGPENFCFATSFVIPGTPIEQQITATFSEAQLPENRCSTGSIAMTYTLPTPNCLAPITGASLFHDGGVIIGQSTGLTSYLFENVPNTTSYEVKLYSGSTVVKTIGSNVPFLGPCGGGGTGNPELTHTTAGCSNGIIMGELTPGNCGPTSVMVINAQTGNAAENTTTWVDGFNADNLEIGTYYILYTRESTATIPCPVSDTITVEILGSNYPNVSATVTGNHENAGCGFGNIQVITSGWNDCTNAIVTITGLQTEMSELSSNDTTTFSNLPAGIYGVSIQYTYHDGHVETINYSDVEVANEPVAEICNGLDDDCDGDLDEDFTDLNTYYWDTDGDGLGDPENTVQACATPPGAVSNDDDCDDTTSGITTFSSPTSPCQATLTATVTQIDPVGIGCYGAHVHVEMNSNACYHTWSLESPELQMLNDNTVWTANAGEPIDLVLPLLFNDNQGFYLVGIISLDSEDISMSCGANTLVNNIASPLGCDAQLVDMDVEATTSLNEPNGSIQVTFTSTSCYPPTYQNVIRITDVLTGEQFIALDDNENSIGILSVPAATYNVDVSYLLPFGECVMLNFASVTVPYYSPADFNTDSVVSTADLNMFLENFGCVGSCEPYDLNGDGVVGAADLQIFIGEYNGD